MLIIIQIKFFDFIKKINLELTHIHTKNEGISKVYLYNNLTVIELTFAKDPIVILNEFAAPHYSDQRNIKELDGMLIDFKN